MNDPQIRSALKGNLVAHYRSDPNTRLIEELGLKHGFSRVDIAIINGELHGYEIKSDRDSLKRLPAQGAIYGLVLDRVTLVLALRHLSKALATAPDWWGIDVAEEVGGEIQFSCVRQASRNPSVCPLSVAKLLWRDEALNLLVHAGVARGVLAQPRKIIYARLVESLSVDDLCAAVRHQLRSRLNWRAGEQQSSCGG